jgi:hypothetical protein
MGKRKAALIHTHISRDEATCLFSYIPVHNVRMGISLVPSMEMLPLLTLLLL